MPITVDEYFMGRRAEYADEFNDKIQQNAEGLVRKVNEMLLNLCYDKASVSSGWRPSAINKRVGGALRSKHLTGEAVDLHDPRGELAALIKNNLNALAWHGLYMEDPASTKGWVHLQDVAPASGKRIFKP